VGYVNNLFSVLDRKTGKLIQRLSFSTTDESDRQKLRDKMDNIIIQCCCRNKVEMKISSKFYFYSVRKAVKHHEHCTKFSNYQSISIYDKGWKSDDEGNHVVRLVSLLPQKEKEAGEMGEKRSRVYTNTSITNGRVEIFGLISKINMMTWERMACSYRKTPNSLEDFGKSLYHTLRSIRPTGMNKTLLEMEYKKSNEKDMKEQKDVAFIYMYVEELEQREGYCLLRVRDRFGSTFRFYVNEEEYKQELQKERGHSDMLVVGGFIYKHSKGAKILTLGKFALIPISKHGLFVESSYEKQVYELLTEAKRVFYKPYLELEEYGGKKPDLILLDGTKKVIGEIFGMNSREYLWNRHEKMVIANQIKYLYDFWKWDAYKGEPLILPI
jgi:hypothetical protein